MIDNAFVAGSMGLPSRTDDMGTTYQMRRLKNGSEYEILKNFPTHDELRSALKRHSTAVSILQLEYYCKRRTRLRSVLVRRSDSFIALRSAAQLHPPPVA